MPELSIEVRQVDQTPTSEGTARQHRVLIDRPKDKGGLDRGPLGGEMLLFAQGGCFMSNLIAAAAARDISVTELKLIVRGELGESPPHFESVIVEVHGLWPDEATMEKIVTIAARSCIVTNTLKTCVKLDIQRRGKVSST